MDPDQYTWDHVFELERIAELIMKEAVSVFIIICSAHVH